MKSNIRHTLRIRKPCWNAADSINRKAGNMRSEVSRMYPLSSHPPQYAWLKAATIPPTFMSLASHAARPMQPTTVPQITNVSGEVLGAGAHDTAGSLHPMLKQP